MNWYNKALEDITKKVDFTSERIQDTLPHVSINGTFTDESSNPRWWTNGYWPGLLWMMYKETGLDKYKKYATSAEKKLDPVLNGFYGIDHDAGFQWHLSSVARFKILGDEDAKRNGMIAASHLAGRFNPSGNFLRAWNWGGPIEKDPHTGWAIIDSMMNLPLLYWATEQTNDPRYMNIAMKVADMVLENFIREDGSSHHIVCFDPKSGKREKALGGQGYSPESVWTRGNAWCIYGMALAYKYTKQKRYLVAAKNAAKFFIEYLAEDFVPVWDFKAPKETHYAKDSSAGAIAASGMLEISEYLEGNEKQYFYDAGSNILKALYKNNGSWEDYSEEALVLNGTVHFPANSNINVPIIYGDFFFTEGIRKLNGKKDILW